MVDRRLSALLNGVLGRIVARVIGTGFMTFAASITQDRTKTLQNTTATLAELETAETLTGAKTFSATANFSANLIVGTDPGGSDLLRVGGAITAGNSTDQARLIQSGTSTMLYLGASTSGGIKRLSYDRSTGSLSFIGGTVFLPSTQMALDNSGNLIVGIDPGGSESLRVGGQIRSNSTLFSSIQATVSGSTKEVRTGIFDPSGSGAGSIYGGMSINTATPSLVIQCLEGGVAWRNVQLALSGGQVTVGVDPGGSELLRVGGSARIGASLTIGTGGTYTAGSIYSDAGWGMIFRAKQAAPSGAEFRWAKSDDVELMRLDSNANLGVGVTPVAGNGLVQLASGTTKSSGIALGDWNAYRAGGSDFFLTPAAATDGYFSVVRSTGERMALGAANSTGIVGTASNHQLSLITNGTTKAVLTTAGLFTVGGINAYSAITANGNASGTAGGAIISAQNNGTSIIALGNYSGVHGGAYDASSVIWGASDLSLGVGALVRFLRITPTAIGIFGNTPVAQATGFGTPTGVSRLINFPGATATLAQCSGAIADLITYLKSRGDLGA